MDSQRSLGVASLILGILAAALSIFLAGIPFIPLIIGVAGIVISVKARKEFGKSGMTTAGFILSVIGVAVSALIFIVLVACAGVLAGLTAQFPEILGSIAVG